MSAYFIRLPSEADGSVQPGGGSNKMSGGHKPTMICLLRVRASPKELQKIRS